MEHDQHSEPRDETTPRPQITFDVVAISGAESTSFQELRRRFLELDLPYHDLMLFGTRAVIRFDWDAPQALVDRVGDWLGGFSSARNVQRHYGPRGSAG